MFLLESAVLSFSFRIRLDNKIVFSPDNSTVRAIIAQHRSTWAEYQHIIFGPDNSTVRAIIAQHRSTWAEYRYNISKSTREIRVVLLRRAERVSIHTMLCMLQVLKA